MGDWVEISRERMLQHHAGRALRPPASKPLPTALAHLQEALKRHQVPFRQHNWASKWYKLNSACGIALPRCADGPKPPLVGSSTCDSRGDGFGCRCPWLLKRREAWRCREKMERWRRRHATELRFSAFWKILKIIKF